MKRLCFPVLFLALLVACGPSENQIVTAIAQTQAAASTDTPIPTDTHVATNTPISTETQAPAISPSITPTKPRTPTTEPTSTSAPTANEDIFALNYLASQESGGLIVEIARVLISDRAYFENKNNWDFNAFDEDFQGKPVVGEILYKITNTSQSILKIYPYRGQVIIGSEQIELADYNFSGAVLGDDLNGEIFPGVTKIGAYGLESVDLP